jgi:alkylation response protein AidB-like acyl-CoA dehydrogenase
MDFELNEQQRKLQQTVREFAATELKAGASQRDKSGEFPWNEIGKMQGLGLFGLSFSTEFGGGGLDFLSYTVCVEELARIDASLTITLLAHTLCASHIEAVGTNEQKRQYLVPLAKGEKLGAWALSEPEAGSDAGGIRTRAIPHDNGWQLTGNKFFITNGSQADILVIMASTDPEQGNRGISAFIVPGDSNGLIKGKNLEKLGFRSSDTVGLGLKALQVPSDALLGERNHGFTRVMEVLAAGRIGVAAMAVGICRACLEDSIAYAEKRHAFGHPIADFQAIQWMLADMATELDAARLLVHRAARRRDAGLPFSKEAAMAKLYASEAATRAALKAVQIHGGHGYLRTFPVERYLREAKLCEIGEGTSEVQRMVISRELLQHGQRH